KRKRLLIQISLFVSLQSVNIASILLSAQSMDTLFISLFGKTCGLGIYPQSGFYCVTQQGDYNSPFGTNYMVATLGFLMTLIMVVPLGIFSLADNIKVQIASFVGLIAILAAWFITFFKHGLTPSYVPDFGDDMSQVIGTVLFNYAFIVTVPSWVNDLDPKVPIQKSVFYSILIATLNYVLLGIIGGMAFPIDKNSDIIVVINQSDERNWLTVSRHCKKGLAIFLSSVLPWIVVMPFQTGRWLNVFVNWTNLFFSSISNFVVPFYLYYLSQKPNIAVQADIKLKRFESDIKRQVSIRSTKSDKSFRNVKDWINSQVITRERLRDGTDAAVGILYNDDDDYNVSAPGTPNSLNPNAEHLHVPGRRIVSAPPTTSKSDPQGRDNHSRPALSLQMPPSIVHRSNLSRRASPPSIPSIEYNIQNTNIPTNIPTIMVQEEDGNNQDIIVELDGSQTHSHSGSDKSQSEKSDSIIFDTPPERFKALPLPDNVRLWIAYICNAGALLTVISVIMYDFVELALGRNVFD
ncbi:16552_t:CDS:2, partial [Dentiscutata heterogama]